jgi:hypothetical protein
MDPLNKTCQYNKIMLFAQKAIISGLICFSLSAFGQNSKPFVPDYPGAIYFGTISFNSQLAINPEGWSFVRQHVDGMIMHPNHTHPADKDYSYYKDSLGIKMAPLLKNMNVAVELGMYLNDSAKLAPVISDPSFSATKANAAVAFIKKIENNFGIKTSEWNWVAWCSNPKMAYTLFPQVGSIDDAWAVLTKKPAGFNKTGFWQEYYYNVIKEVRKQLPSHYVWFNMPPVYYDIVYNGVTYPASNDYGNFGNGVHLGGAQYYKAYNDAAVAAQNFHGYSADYPFRFWLNDQKGVEKIVAVCKYHHDLGAKFSQIMIGDGDETDSLWYMRSMDAFRRYQLYGGRADRYLFQSWKVNGPPFTLVPESGGGKTYMKLIKDALVYLKGCDEKSQIDLYATDSVQGKEFGRNVYMKEPSGVQQIHYILKKGEKRKVTLSFVNRHPEVTIFPVLKAVHANTNGFTIKYDHKSTLITDSILSSQGWPYTLFLPRTSIRYITAEIENVSASGVGVGKLDLYAIWNPQDPTGEIRDALSVSFSESAPLVANSMQGISNVKALSISLKSRNLFIKGILPGTKINVYNLQGKIVFSGALELSDNKIALSNAGVYFVKTMIGQEEITETFIVK